MEVQIFRQNNFVLTCLGTKLIGRVFQIDCIEVYEGQIPSIDKQEIISTFFESKEEIIDYMKIKQNIKFDSDLMTIKLLSRMNSKNKKFIEICQINLISVQIDLKKKIINVIRECNIDAEFSKDHVKKCIKTIGQGLLKLIIQKEQEKSTIRPKLEHLHQQSINQQMQLFKEQMYAYVEQKKRQDSIRQTLQELMKINIQSLSNTTKKLQLKFNSEYTQVINIINQLNVKVSQQLERKVKELSNVFANKQDLQIITNKLRGLNLSLYKIQQKIFPNPNDDIIVKQTPKPFINNPNYLENSLFIKTQNRIKYIGENNVPTDYIFDKIIPQDNKFSFKIKILQQKQSTFYIGILNYEQRKNKRCSSNSKSYCYGSHGGGFINNANMKEGNGFKQGDIVEVIVNMPKNKIKWLVNGIKEASCRSSFQNKIFKPFVQFYFNNTSVQWICQ